MKYTDGKASNDMMIDTMRILEKVRGVLAICGGNGFVCAFVFCVCETSERV